VDPLNPIIPPSGLSPGIPRTPAVPRVSPDEQRQQARDDEHAGQEPDHESFDEALDEATTEEFSSPEEFFIPEVNRFKPNPAVERPTEERRASEDESDDDDAGPGHIDIIA
jgi:hypothetical protein